MQRISRNTVLSLTAIFGVALSVTLAVHQVAMPTNPSQFPLLDPEINAVWTIPSMIMLLTYPVLFLNFNLLVHELIGTRASFRQLGLAFGIASLLILLLIMLVIFTSTWSYVAVALEPAVRNRFWQLYGLMALLLTLSTLVVRNDRSLSTMEALEKGFGQVFIILVAAIGLGALLGAILLAPRPPSAPVGAESLKVVGYNLQQGYTAGGQRGHQKQCQVLKEIGADIVALSETDTSRIAGGNFDIVRFMAQCLNMYEFVGPKTGVGTFGYALLSKYEIQNPETYHLFSGPGYPSCSNPDEFSDGDQVAVLKAEVVVDGKRFTIFVNHFDSDPPCEQPRGFASLVGDVSDNVIAIGDYNCRPESDCVDIVLTALEHCDLEKAEDEVDHIFVSSDLNCTEYTYIERNASDHPAVAAEISW
jgi:endonuclease/exonuclease/phosphatase family metal-dependent hydrolase